MSDLFRLAPQQKHAWLHGLIMGEPAVVDISGPLDVDRLRRALQTLTDEHEVLRSRLASDAELRIPRQQILDAHEVRLDGALAEKSGVSFRLQGSGDVHQLIISGQGLWLDPRGLELLVEHLAVCYDRNAAPTPLDDQDEPPLQFADLAEWFHDLAGDEEGEAGRRFWREQQLVTAAGFGDAVAAQSVRLTDIGRLDALSQELGVDRAMIAAAAWRLVLHRSGVDGLFGMVAPGRDQEDLATALGFFARVLPTPVDMPANFGELVHALRHRYENAVKWQDFFAWDLQDDYRDARPPYTPLVFEAVATPQTHGGFRLQPQLTQAEPHTHALRLFDDHLLLQAPDAERLGERLTTLLTALRADTPTATAPLIGAAERQALLTCVNAGAVDNDRELAFHQLFARFAQNTPDKPAVAWADGGLSYGQLDRHADHLAAQLQARGVRCGDRVALYLDRSPELVVALLAAHKAGAAYVPVDPEFPQARVTHILEDSRPALVLTSARQNDAPVDALRVDLNVAATDRPAATGVGPDDLAYVIYTSGTTGKPKGVCISHRALINYTQGVLARLDLAPDDDLTTFATVAADLGNTSLFGALGGGRTYRILPEALRLDAEGLAAELERRPVACLKIVPSHLNMLLDVDRPERLLPTRCLVLGGERFDRVFGARLRKLAPHLRLINHYGPTEATVGITTHERPAGPLAEEAGSVPVGRPLDNSEVHVVDDVLELKPFGAVGELLLGGPSLAQGYWSRPALTAERFVPNPFTSTPGARLYKSGDLANILDSNEIELRNRIDHQIKIRGFRIELGEIEATLVQHPQIQNTVVVVEGEGEPNLTAHLVLTSDADLKHADLSRWLGERLPHVMHPAHFSVLPHLPVNANGKIDRNALPKAAEAQGLQREYTAPTGDIETALCDIWRELLGVDQLSVYDNFLDMGAHSFLIIRANQKIKERLKRNLNTVDLYTYPNVRALSQFLAQGAEALDQSAVQNRADRKRQAMNANRLRNRRR